MTKLPMGERIIYGIMAIFVLGLLIPLISFPLPPPPTTPDERQKAVVIAAPVVDALQRYKRDHGQGPANLGVLVPKYLPRLPEPPKGIISGKEYLYAPELQTWYLGIPLRGERNTMLTYCYKFDKNGSWMYLPSPQ